MDINSIKFLQDLDINIKNVSIVESLRKEVDQLKKVQTELCKHGSQLTVILKEMEKKLNEYDDDDKITLQKVKDLEEELEISEKENIAAERRLYSLTRGGFHMRELNTFAYKKAKEAEAEATRKLKKMYNQKNKVSKAFEEIKLNQDALEEKREKQIECVEKERSELENMKHLFISRNLSLKNTLDDKQEQKSKNENNMALLKKRKEELQDQVKNYMMCEQNLSEIKNSLMTVIKELSDERRNIISLQIECKTLESTLEKNKEEKMLADVNISKLTNSICIKKFEIKNRDDEIKIWKQQLKKENKEKYILQKKIFILENRKSEMEKLSEIKKIILSNKSKEYDSLKKIKTERQNITNELGKQKIITDEELQKVRSAKENNINLLKFNQNKEDIILNNVKKMKTQKVKLQNCLKKSKINKLNFITEHNLLSKELKNSENELNNLIYKLKDSEDYKERKQINFAKIQSQHNEINNLRNKTMTNYQKNRVNVQYLQQQLQSFMDQENLMKEKLIIEENEKNRRRLMYDKYCNEMDNKEKELVRQIKLEEELSKEHRDLAHNIIDLEEKLREKNNEIDDVNKQIIQEEKNMKRMNAKLSRMEKTFQYLKKEVNQRVKILECTNRNNNKFSNYAEWLELQFGQLRDKYEILSLKEGSLELLKGLLMNNYRKLNEEQSYLAALENNIHDPSNTNQWRLIPETYRDSLIERNKCLQQREFLSKMKNAAMNFKISQMNEEINVLSAGRREATVLSRNLQYIKHLVRVKTNQLKGLKAEKNMFYSMLDKEENIKVELLEELKKFHNEYLNMKEIRCIQEDILKVN